MTATVISFKEKRDAAYLQLLLCISIGSVEFDFIRFIESFDSKESCEDHRAELVKLWSEYWIYDSSGVLEKPRGIYGNGKAFITKIGLHTEVILLSKQEKIKQIEKGAAFLSKSFGNLLLVQEMPLDLADKMVHAVYHFSRRKKMRI